jgi:hypothetical protein
MKRKKSDFTLNIATLHPETLISSGEAAKFLGLCIRSLERYRQERLGPKFIRLSAHTVRYRVRDLQEFCARREVETA